jgi:DNA-binding GntR family transcriptional regulator
MAEASRPNPPPPLDRPGPAAGSAAQRVYEDLRRRIVALELEPDTPLSRPELAATYGTSQTPVREALQRLEQDGLVLIFPQSRTVVARIDVDQLHETHFLRVSLETEVARQLAARSDPAVVAQARALLRMQEAALEGTPQIEMFNELDRSFHHTLFAAVGMGRLHQFVSRRLGHLYRCQRLELPRAGKTESILAAHHAVVDGIASGDPERAAEAMRDHLSGTIRRIAVLRDEHPGFFTGPPI